MPANIAMPNVPDRLGDKNAHMKIHLTVNYFDLYKSSYFDLCKSSYFDLCKSTYFDLCKSTYFTCMKKIRMML